MVPFATPEDAHKKLSGALITYSGDLFRCIASRPALGNKYNEMVTIYPLGSPDKMQRVDYTANEFQVIPYELGFLNDKENEVTVLCGRNPERNSNVGIDPRNVLINRPGSGNTSYLPAVYYDGKSHEKFRDMIYNRYPSFDEAHAFILKAKKANACIAFNKNYALVKGLDDEDETQVYLYHLDRRIAKYNPTTGKFVTSSKPRRFMLNMIAKSGVIPHVSIA